MPDLLAPRVFVPTVAVFPATGAATRHNSALRYDDYGPEDLIPLRAPHVEPVARGDHGFP